MRLFLSLNAPCAALALALALGSSTLAAQNTAPPTKSEPSPDQNSESKTPATPDSSYRIGVGDVLHIAVWEEPQFTETAVVRPDGMISMPLISDISVLGLTPASAESLLATDLQKFVHKPRVTVTVQEIHSRMVYVTGEVERPGAYPLVDSMNVVQLIARSGGPTDFAKKKRVYVLRAGTHSRVNVDYQKLLKGQAAEQNVVLLPGDTVVVP